MATCLLGVLLAIPVTASANLATEVTGTVTASDTGLVLAGIPVSVYCRVGSDTWRYDGETDAEGHYIIGLDLSEDAIFAVFASDDSGIYDSVSTAESPIAFGEIKNVDLMMAKDSTAPMVGLYADSRMLLSVKSAGQLAAAALPDGIERWAFISDGTERMGIDADDGHYINYSYWGHYDGSGIQNVGWAVDGGAWVFKTPFETTYTDWYDDRALRTRHEIPALSEGVHTVSFQSTDANGNTSRKKSELVVVDKTAPYTTYNKAAATTKKLTLTASDALTGVLATFVRTGNTGAYKYGTAISVPSTGYKYVQFYSLDKIGNTETARKLKVSAPAKLTTPQPSTSSVSHTRSFRVVGSVYGRSKATGYVLVYKYNNGAYHYVSKKAFTEGSDGKYRVSMRLARGTYRFKTAYGAYTATWANPPVRSSRSARVNVW
ncbi:MAG: hypothetical protein CVT67_02655 [Actinobacteria bacterium HGW-Actinobacteria-7]|nr:MAG: hypothetical protein CVT67_02655 [Actinobacteria bacterium HGW-Actinobacteria-7]